MKNLFVVAIALVTICCGIANGILSNNFGSLKNCVFALASTVLCLFLLYIHWKMTRTWEKPEPDDDIWSDDMVIPVFKIVMYLSLYFLVIFCFTYFLSDSNDFHEMGFIVAWCSIAVSSTIGYFSEKSYTVWLFRREKKVAGSAPFFLLRILFKCVFD